MIIINFKVDRAKKDDNFEVFERKRRICVFPDRSRSNKFDRSGQELDRRVLRPSLSDNQVEKLFQLSEFLRLHLR